MKKVLFLFLIIILFIPSKVKAYSVVKDSFYKEKEISTNIKEYEKIDFIKRKKDNMPSYTLKPYTIDENKKIDGYVSNTYNFTNLDSKIWRRVMMIAYYGYNYYNHSDIKWYIVTQFMIWKEVNKENFSFVDNVYSTEIEEIENLISKYNIKVSFKYGITGILNEENKVEDTNNVLDEYEIDPDPTIEARKENNTLIFKPTSKNNSYIVLRKKDKLYDHDMTFYIDGDKGNIITVGSLETVTSSILVKGLEKEIEEKQEIISDKYMESVEEDKEYSVEVNKIINNYYNDNLISKEKSEEKIVLYAKDDIYTESGSLKYSKDEEVSVVSKENGFKSKLVNGNYYINSDSGIYDIKIDNKNMKVTIEEGVYKYGTIIDNVPDTYTSDNMNCGSIFVFLGFIFIYRGKKYEI